MLETLAKRGPDNTGIALFENAGMGHSRLAIIDLSAQANQPMQYNEYVLVFNGELYNYKQVRTELELLNHCFASTSDTEVLLHAYAEWGSAGVQKFEGMWAFAIYNTRTDAWFLSRDRFGIKPLYYYIENQTLIFASELKAIRKIVPNLELDIEAVNSYFLLKYINGNRSLYKNCFKLPPASHAVFANGQLSVETYYLLKTEIAGKAKLPVALRLTEIKTTLAQSVCEQLVADVPVGCFLSGGLDSSVITAYASRYQTDIAAFSIGFNQKSYDETIYSKLVAANLKVKLHIENAEFTDKVLFETLDYLDEPFGDPSFIPTCMVSALARKYATVSLSGDGADEIFAGYDTYSAYLWAKLIPKFLSKLLKKVSNKIPDSDIKVSIAFKLKRFFRNLSDEPLKRHILWTSVFTDDLREELLNKNFISFEKIVTLHNQQDVTDLQIWDIENYLPNDILRKADAASMLHSLELRVPFLHSKLVPLVLSLPTSKKISLLNRKISLKKIAANLVPIKILNRKKRGFTVPVSKIIKENKTVQNVLTNEVYFKHGILNKQFCSRMLEQHLAGKRDNARELWLVFVFNYVLYKNNIW